jgi:MFS family permease
MSSARMHAVDEPAPRPQRLITGPFVAVSVSALLFFSSVGVLIPMIPRFIEDELGGHELAIGLNLVAFSVAAVAIRPTLGALGDRRGRRTLMILGGLVGALSSALVGFSSSMPMLLALRALAGIGEAALFVGAATLIADLAPPERRAEAASYFSVAVFGGIGVGPIAGEALLDGDHFVRAFGAASVFALASVVVTILFVERTPAQLVGVRGSAPRFHRAALGPGSLLGAGVAGFAVFIAFTPALADEVGLGGASSVFAVYSLLCLAVRIFGARIPERIGLPASVTVALASIAVGLVVASAIDTKVGLYAATVAIGVGVSFLYPSLNALAVNGVPALERAAVLATFTMFFEIGSAFGGLVFGSVAQLTSKQTGLLVAASAPVVGLLVFHLRSARATRPRTAASPM